MDAPKCRLCGKKHWGLCNPDDLPEPEDLVDYGKQVDPPKEEDSLAEWTRKRCPEVPKRVVEKEGRLLVTRKLSKVERVRLWRKENPERYREYMRGYMARKRAKDTSPGS